MWQLSRAVFAVGIVALTVSIDAARAQSGEAINVQPNAYSMTQSYFKLPNQRSIGNTAGIALDADGTSIWVYDACGGVTCVGSDLNPILKFDASGNLVTQFGAGMFLRPHTIHIDPEGNVWVTDREGPDGVDPRRDGRGHQVFKFTADGELLMTLGTAGVTGDGPNEFYQPSAVLVAPNGDIFVGDGHGGESNARIVKFSADGTFIATWGGKGSAPGIFSHHTRLRWTPQGGSLSVTERMGAYRYSIRTDDFSRNGDNSAVQAECT